MHASLCSFHCLYNSQNALTIEWSHLQEVDLSILVTIIKKISHRHTSGQPVEIVPLRLSFQVILYFVKFDH